MNKIIQDHCLEYRLLFLVHNMNEEIQQTTYLCGSQVELAGFHPGRDLEVRRAQVLLKVYRMLGKIWIVKRASAY